MAIFPPVYEPLPTETKRQIFQQHRQGDSAEALARRFCRSAARIYSIIREIRVRGSWNCRWTAWAASSSPASARRRSNTYAEVNKT